MSFTCFMLIKCLREEGDGHDNELDTDIFRTPIQTLHSFKFYTKPLTSENTHDANLGGKEGKGSCPRTQQQLTGEQDLNCQPAGKWTTCCTTLSHCCRPDAQDKAEHV